MWTCFAVFPSCYCSVSREEILWFTAPGCDSHMKCPCTVCVPAEYMSREGPRLRCTSLTWKRNQSAGLIQMQHTFTHLKVNLVCVWIFLFVLFYLWNQNGKTVKFTQLQSTLGSVTKLNIYNEIILTYTKKEGMYSFVTLCASQAYPSKWESSDSWVLIAIQ